MNVENSFRKFYAIMFLLVLTNNCAFANINNVKNEQPSLAKVLTSYLKVPWINLNSSWTDRVAPNCKNDISTFFASAQAGEMWALNMLDATSKIPAGILTGNIRDLGMYDQCIGVRAHENRANIQGKHCMVSLAMPTKFVADASETLKIQKVSIYNPSTGVDFSLTASVCFPSSCGVDDILGFVDSSIQSTPELVAFEVSVVEATCSDIKIEDDLVLGRILVLVFFAIVIGLLIYCTICDFVIRARSDYKPSSALETAAKFSLYTNMIKLTSTKTDPDTMGAIHGIRFLNTCLILIAHRIVGTLIKPLVNLADAYTLQQTFIAIPIHMLPYIPDTFFVLSGFLTAYLFLKALREGQKFNILKIYIHRYLRLTPCVGLLILFSIFFLPYLGSGPMWDSITDPVSGFCRNNWWTNLLYVQNFVNPEKMCMLHTWYLAVEMQLFWMAPIILYPLFYRPKISLVLLGLLSIVLFIAPGVQLAVYKWSALFHVHKNIRIVYHEFWNFYPRTYNRALPYTIGIFMAYDLVNNKRQFTKLQVVRNWILTCSLILFSGGVVYFIQPNAPDFNIIWEIIYVTFGRLSWSIAMAWILYACTQGHGGVATRFLSLPMFVPLSRMSYSIYLVHFVIQLANNAAERTAEHNTPFGVFNLIWGDLALSIGMAFIVTLCFDSPVIALEKILFSKRSPRISRVDPPRKTRELADIIKEYLDQTRSQLSADSAVERTTRQWNLQRAVSEILKTSAINGTKKTPAEWAKAWHDWRSYLVRNDRQQDTRLGNDENGTLQSQIGTPAMEKELLIFLAGVSCGLGEAPSIESEMSMGQKSQAISCDWKNENLRQLPTLNSTSLDKKRSKFSGPTSAEIEYPHRKVNILP